MGVEFISNETYLLIRGMCQRYVGTLPFKLKEQMRKIFTLFLLLIPLWMQAQDDDIWDEGTKTLTVILGETTEYSSYKDQAKHLVIKAGTETEIPTDAFRYDWKKVEDICIESGVTAIGNYAFADCTAKTVDIPESVTSIGQYAFNICTALTEITIPGSVKSIGQQAFSFCSALGKWLCITDCNELEPTITKPL